jgi:uncharacterized membrane protein affecting hemolysin expression
LAKLPLQKKIGETSDEQPGACTRFMLWLLAFGFLISVITTLQSRKLSTQNGKSAILKTKQKKKVN